MRYFLRGGERKEENGEKGKEGASKEGMGEREG